MHSSTVQGADFSADAVQLELAGMLFDMDGTIIDSTEAVVKHWQKIGMEIHVDPSLILASSHGVRSIDVLKIHAPQKATWEYVSFMEGQIPLLYGSNAVEIPGARALLSACAAASVPWAIVTSGTQPLVSGWLRILDLPRPEHLITAEDVPLGKPDPECYRLGLKALGLLEESSGQPVREVLVLEDSPAGIRAGKAAGCTVLAVVTSHTTEEVVQAGADYVVKDLSSIRILDNFVHGSFLLEIKNGLVKC